MDCHLNRREFLATAAASAALASATRGIAAPFKTKLQKALIGVPTPETLAAWKEAGFAGMETAAWDVAPEAGREGAWRRGEAGYEDPLGSPRAGPISTARMPPSSNKTWRPSRSRCAPPRLTARMPCCWCLAAWTACRCRSLGFSDRVRSEDRHVTEVVAGDNTRYQAYIDAQNRARKARVPRSKSSFPSPKRSR